MSGFIKATKQMAKAKIAMIGPSGAGKTFSALRCARGLTNNGRVAVLDSENNSASLYSDKFEGWEYFVLPVAPPYTARKYLDAIELAVREKFDCLIIDSLTHVWAGEGGLLQQKEALDSRAGSNSYTNWQQITKVHEVMKSKILYSPIHIITTMRSKQEYVMEQNDRGKMAPRKVGLKPIQRDDLEYEFTVVFDIGMDHQFIVSKDRTDLFDGMVSKVTEQTGTEIRAWLADEIQTPEVVDEAPAPSDIPKPGPTTAPRTQPPQQRLQSAARQPSAPPAATLDVMYGPDPMGSPPPVAKPQLNNTELDALKNSHGTVGVTSIVAAQENKARAQQRQVKNHATGQMVDAPASEQRFSPPHQDPTVGDSAEYVIKCGGNLGMIGKKIIEINETTLAAALKQADALLIKGSGDQALKEFAYHARKFLRDMGVAV